MTRRRCDSVAIIAPRECRAVSLAECLISVVLVGGLLATSLELVGRSVVAATKNADRARAALLAEALVAEIASMPYEDPDGAALLGMEPGETDSCRCGLDDVDDFDGYTESPPAARDGKPLPGFSGWTRKVTVSNAATGDPMQNSLLDTGLKRIEVTVWHGDVPVARLYGLKQNDAAEPVSPIVLRIEDVLAFPLEIL